MANNRARRLLKLGVLLELWDWVRSSLWFVPGLISLAAAVLALLVPRLDRAVPDRWISGLPLVFSGEPVGARAVLQTIATSTITIAGVVFSMTLVSLQLASSQFGPRLLRTFLRDRGNQLVLGTFVGTFLYCVLVLPNVNAGSASQAVPRVAVTLAVLMTLASLAMLVYYIDHVAQSIHADAVIEAVGRELDQVIDVLFPEDVGRETRPAEEPAPEAADPEFGAPVTSDRAGYIRFINSDAILDVAREGGFQVRLDADPGAYVIPGDTLASVSAAAACTEERADQIRQSFSLGIHRTTLQDCLFAFEQLAEMAVRALSPSINDPNTAIHCIDRLGAGVAVLVERERPSRYRRDDEGNLRVIADPVALERVLEVTVDPILRNAGCHLGVHLCLLRTLENAVRRARRPAELACLRQRALRVVRDSERRFEDPSERRQLQAASAWLADNF